MKRQNYRLNRKSFSHEKGDTYRAKKRFGQHFLNDERMAEAIVDAVPKDDEISSVLEIGPGQGVLTKYLLKRFPEKYFAIEIDRDLSKILKKQFPEIEEKLFNEDFLKFNLSEKLKGKIAVVGNFPYNISTEILFHVLEYRDAVKSVTGMFQKEVARRIAAGPGSKEYGIVSVLLACWFNSEYLFELPPESFDPPPKVHSAVVRLQRNDIKSLDVDEALFKRVVKAAFNQRRKQLRNSLSVFFHPQQMLGEIFTKRPEQLSLKEFKWLVRKIESENTRTLF